MRKCFFGELNPLSNFHRNPFSINSTTYHSSEQYIQHQKSILFGDKGAKKIILMVETLIQCKAISRNINNFDPATWRDNAKASCTPGILAKFEQHLWLAKLLISTKGYKLVESCSDQDWGTGVPLHVPNVLKSCEWHSQGLLGEILETVRNIITLHSTTQPTAMEVSKSPSSADTVMSKPPES